jgi:acyl carrier protein/short-subunit dehydrogenase
MSQAKHIGKIVLSMPAEQGNTASGKAPSVRSDASYLITGGLGGLGLLVARWLVSRGVRHLLLAGRASPSPAARQVLDELERSGVQVRVEQADVSQGEHVARLLAAAATLPPLRGVIHAAGILDDGILFEQDDERLAKVMAPKVEGAWNLHVQTRAIPLDFFVLFSSMASLLGSAGQGNYAAGNAFLDALAHLRRAQNLPAQSVNWGPWAQAGMAAALGHAGAQRFADRGVELIAPEAGLEALGEVLVRNPIQVAVLPIDWEHYARAVDNGRASPLLRELVRERPRTRPPDDPAQIESPPERPARELPREQLRDRLRSQVQERVMRVLGLDPSQHLDGRQSLTDLGLDSLMAVELVNALAKATGHRLPSDLVFNRPTVEVLTDYLASQSDKARADGGSRATVAEPAAAPSPHPTVPAPAFARRGRFGGAGPLAKIAALIKPNRR